MLEPLLVRGMHGLGDNLHQRAILAQLMERHEVWLETSWAALYHDLIARGLRVVHKATALRTQARNAERERDRFDRTLPPRGGSLQILYRPDDIRRLGTPLAVMCEVARCDYGRADFRLPIPRAWDDRARAIIQGFGTDKPVMIYRPIVLRSEWGGNISRNADPRGYRAVFEALRPHFFVVSIADLAPGLEWIAGEEVQADATFHRGELEFETLAALTARAGLVYTPSGFAGVLGPAVSTPTICVFGGYEVGTTFDAGARFSPVLGIKPPTVCGCYTHKHNCPKQFDVPKAIEQALAFVTAHSSGAQREPALVG